MSARVGRCVVGQGEPDVDDATAGESRDRDACGRGQLRANGADSAEYGNLELRQRKPWCIAQVDAEFVYHVEDMPNLHVGHKDPPLSGRRQD